MNSKALNTGLFITCTLSLLFLGGCGKAKADEKAKAPPAANIVPSVDLSLFSVEHPEQFPLATAEARSVAPELVVTGTVIPDVSRNVPVVSLASGRVTAIHTRLGDTVKKGQLLLTIRSDDVSGGYSNYRKAIADEVLARAQFERSRDLYQHGAIAQSDLEVAQDTEVTIASSIQAFNTPSPFTISDLSRVWIMCDVYENDLAGVRLGDPADVRLNAYPDRVFHATVNNIGAIMDPNIRTAKVRLEVENPAIMRVGMFVKATFRGQNKEMHTIVPAAAIMRMHDRDFVFVPAREKKFRRLEVVSGDLLPNNMLDVKSGIQPGQQVVTNPLTLDHVLAQ